MKYFEIPVTIVAKGGTLEEAQNSAWLFMPWGNGKGTWTIDQHKHLDFDNNVIDSWSVPGVDDDEMEAMLRERGLR